jgi:hypothetical protein
MIWSDLILRRDDQIGCPTVTRSTLGRHGGWQRRPGRWPNAAGARRTTAATRGDTPERQGLAAPCATHQLPQAAAQRQSTGPMPLLGGSRRRPSMPPFRRDATTPSTDGPTPVSSRNAACDRRSNYATERSVPNYLAEGGGRELAYVAMSRACGPNIVHAVADGLDQAIEDITHDWSLDRNRHWITRTATIGIEPAVQTLPHDPDSRRARLLAEPESSTGRAGPYPSGRAIGRVNG